MILTVSDTHLGHDDVDREPFMGFLTTVRDELQPDHLVLNGDIEDLWRRDMRTLTRDDQDLFGLLEDIEDSGTAVHYVLGNHDWYARHDTEEGLGSFYTTDYAEDVEIEDDGTTYTFVHGHQFDPVQQEAYFDLLAEVTDDALGDGFDQIWSAYNEVTGAGEAIEKGLRMAYDHITSGSRKDDLYDELAEMDRCQNGPDDRGQLRDAEAYAADIETDVLCFGHTHNAAISEDGDVVNSGSWLGEEQTYVVLDGDGPQLMDWNDGEPYEVTDAVADGRV